MSVHNLLARPVYLGVLIALALSLAAPAERSAAHSASSPSPSSVTIAGSLQSQLGCSSNWQADCAASSMTFDGNSDVWRGSLTLAAGGYEYKGALNNSWAENYGLNAQLGGANIPLNLTATTTVNFYYDHKSHWITDNRRSVIATVAGSFQHQLGCSGDWDPSCLRSWLEDPTGSGIYSFETTALLAGNYEAKVTLNESWDTNYGQNGVPGGSNIAFHVSVDHQKVSFSYDPTSHVLTILAGHAHDNNVEWDGLRHDSRDTLYRTPGGAAPAGATVAIRFRTFHDDVTSVTMRVYDLNASAAHFVPMTPAATDVSCYQPGLETESCDFWTASVSSTLPDNIWYRFIIADGTKTAYYADNTSALDGGMGSPSDTAVDNSYALMFYDPSFTTPAWVRNAVIYQIFPDRFRNGDQSNDPKTGAPRYADPVIALPWGTLPEGFCRNYADANTNCPWRFDAHPPSYSPLVESPRGRDYFGGDLKGVTDKLDYLDKLGVTAIYFNPIFYAQSNHRYDTANYLKIDPSLGDLQDFRKLVKTAKSHGIRIILDGVFNHMSSDSPAFDRYRRFTTVGACESATSPFRNWFTFRAPGAGEPAACAPSSPGGADTFYNGWAGFDSIPVLNKTNPAVQNYFVSANDSVTRYWLDQGASGWRLDVMGDSSFPSGYWEAFRQVVKQEDPNALIIGELWQKDSTLLRFLRGDRADTTMNYRLRDAVIGFLSPGNFDPKGFPDSGHPLKPSEFSARLLSMREDYPDVTYYALMNLLDSHDTARLRWALTPGAETTADKEQNAANVAAGKRRVQLASLIQFTLPGAPTIYYGDEVAMTGADDPDDRRTYPWADQGGKPDQAMLAHYRTLSAVRDQVPALRTGDFRVLLSNDMSETVAYGRKTGSQAAIVVANRSSQTQTVDIAVGGYLPDGLRFAVIYDTGDVASGKSKQDGSAAFNRVVAGGILHASLSPMSGMVLATREDIDLTPPASPAALRVTGEGNATVSLAWKSVDHVAGYNLYRSPVSGGGWVKANTAPITATSYTDMGLRNAQLYYFIVKALDKAGNESAASNEVSAIPHYAIGWANLQWPPTLTHTISAITRTDNVYGQVWIDGVTSQPGQTPSLRAQLGFGPSGSNPASNPAWNWVEAGFNTDAGNNDEFVASLLPETTGTFDYLYRYTTTGGRDWLYADLNGPISAGNMPPHPGRLTVTPSSDTTPPVTPANLHVTSASPAGIGLAWDAVTGDPTLYGYEVLRSAMTGGPYATLALVTGLTTYTDTNVVQGATYYYVVRAVDTSFNRSGLSNEISATAQLRTVTVVFNVTVPATTDGTARAVHIAGFLDRLDGNLPQWDPAAVALTRVDSTHWTISLSGKESTQIEYKYALGDWNFVEKDSTCGEVTNRQLTLSYGGNGTQTVNDAVLNWRNVAPCGN